MEKDLTWEEFEPTFRKIRIPVLKLTRAFLYAFAAFVLILSQDYVHVNSFFVGLTALALALSQRTLWIAEGLLVAFAVMMLLSPELIRTIGQII
ncbi:MAG TPA: hypothetical protein VIL09_13165 [Microvirga sp.]|jgi:hypothetical protein